MPALPRLKVRVLDELSRELRFAPREAILRDMTRAGELAADIDPAREYPEEWLVFRITGYRPEGDALAGAVAGREILRDLSALIERLSNAAALRLGDLRQEHPPGYVLTLPELATRWRVSRRSIERYRRDGLIARRARDEGGHAVLVFLLPEVEVFERDRGAARLRAGEFSRLSDEEQDRIIARARRYRLRFGCTMMQAASRLAIRSGRSREAIRRLLVTHDADPGPNGAIFARRASADERRRELAWRAWRRGIGPSEIASHLSL